MECPVQCSETLRLQAYFDAEVDAVSAADIERHMERCAECRAQLQDLEQMRAALRRELPVERAPAALRARLGRALDQEPASAEPEGSRWARRPRGSRMQWPKRPFWMGAFSGGFAAAIAATLAFVILGPSLGNPLVEDLLGAHLRSLMADHLIDVVSTDKHTVKPWFAGHTDVSPVVADFTPQGYRLMGGRADYLDHQRSAVVVYQHGPHVINVFSWAGREPRLPTNTTRNGYHFIFWKSGDIDYCAVSDTAPDELRGLVQLLQGQSAGEASTSR
jgi:anti-sigma factor RsiW